MSAALEIAGDAGPSVRAGPRVDVIPLGLGLAAGALAPAIPAIAAAGPWGMALATCLLGLAICWVSNTVAHLHLHRPLIRPAALGRAYSLYLSALTGVPQTIWRARHLAHHRGRAVGRIRLGLQGALEVAIVVALWIGLAVAAPALLLFVYAPGFALGMLLCQLQGRGEHLGGEAGGISHYGRIYNLLWLNDGYHAEHHRWPGAHWRRLPGLRLPSAPASREAPHLRGRDALIPGALVALERLALRSPALQRRLVDRHARAFAALAPAIRACLKGPVPEDMSRVRVAIVGGGLFPRSALALAGLWPDAEVTVIEADADHLEEARRILAARGLDRVRLCHGRWAPGGAGEYDLVIVPLALVGDRDAVYASDGPPRLVHDWIWRRRGRAGLVVAWWLAKRINLVDGTGR